MDLRLHLVDKRIILSRGDRMKNFEITWVGIFRVFRVADKLISQGGELSQFDIYTYKFLFEQLGDDEKEYIIGKFGDNLTFLNE